MPELEQKSQENSSDKRDRSSKKSKVFQNKIVIRKLPPNLSSEEFFEQIEPLPELIDRYYCKPDWTLGGEATARAYLEFKNEDDVSCTNVLIINKNNVRILYLTDFPIS